MSGTGASSARVYVYSRVAASEPANYVVTLSVGVKEVAATMLAYSGTATTGLVDASGGTTDLDADVVDDGGRLNDYLCRFIHAFKQRDLAGIVVDLDNVGDTLC